MLGFTKEKSLFLKKTGQNVHVLLQVQLGHEISLEFEESLPLGGISDASQMPPRCLKSNEISLISISNRILLAAK